MSENSKTDLFDFAEHIDDYAVMGNPVTHSKSPRIHSLFAEQTKQKIRYTAIHVDQGGFKQAVGNFRANNGKGLNVTVPFKQQAWQIVDERSQRAELAGAVNTIQFDSDRLIGDNTDGIGLVNDLKNNQQIELNNKRILLMGAGGAARGVIAPLLNEALQVLMIANRTTDKAKDLADQFSDYGPISGCGYGDLNGNQFDIIINATAASLNGELPPLPDKLLNSNAACYDMMYGQITPFMQWAQQQGVTKIMDGLGMLVEQAAESFFIWRNVRPDTVAVIKILQQENQS